MAQWKVASPIYANNPDGYATDPVCHGGPKGTTDEVFGMTHYAFAPIGCDSGEIALIVQTNDAWKIIFSGSGEASCAAISQYAYPTALLRAGTNGNAECAAADGSVTRLN